MGIEQGTIIPFPERRKNLSTNTILTAELTTLVSLDSQRLKREQEAQRPDENAKTASWISYFDNNWRKEGLPRSWEKLQQGGRQIGFSMDAQINLLRADDLDSRRTWVSQTRRDIQGFTLEYLSPHIVYPWRYEKQKTEDGIAELVDPRYGGRRMSDTVSEKERNGAVKKVVGAIEKAIIEEKIPEGSMLVQVSPRDKTPTGLIQDNGDPVVYDDTHLIFSQVKDGGLSGITIKTDFTKTECREFLKRLTGKALQPDASIEEYIETVAFINSETVGRPVSIDDVVSVAAKVRSDLAFGSEKAFKHRSWQSVFDQIKMGEKLYDFDDKTQAILKQFEADVILDNPTREELPKYIAATILRISQIAQIARDRAKSSVNQDIFIKAPTYGDTLKKTTEIPGCAGGGLKSALSGLFGISRSVNSGPGGASGSSCPDISCRQCTWKANESEASSVQSGNLKNCPKCGWSPKAA